MVWGEDDPGEVVHTQSHVIVAGAPLVTPKIEVDRKNVPSTVMAGEWIPPITISIWNRADATIGYRARFIGVGRRSGQVIFDVYSASSSVPPNGYATFSSGSFYAIMPEEDINLTIQIEAI